MGIEGVSNEGHTRDVQTEKRLAAQTYGILGGASELERRYWLHVHEDGTLGSLQHATQRQLDAIFDLAMVPGADWKEKLLQDLRWEKEFKEWDQKPQE